MNVLELELSRASARNTSPLAQASTLTSDPGLCWPKAFRVECAVIDLLERHSWPIRVPFRPDEYRPVIVETRLFFSVSL